MRHFKRWRLAREQTGKESARKAKRVGKFERELIRKERALAEASVLMNACKGSSDEDGNLLPRCNERRGPCNGTSQGAQCTDLIMRDTGRKHILLGKSQLCSTLRDFSCDGGDAMSARLRSGRIQTRSTMGRIRIGAAIGVLTWMVIFAAARSAASTGPGAPAVPAIQTSDVDHFYKIYDAADGHPTADQLQNDYIDSGSDGLHVFANLRRISGITIAEALAKHPEIYSSAKRCMIALPRVRQRLGVAFQKLHDFYPAARLPPVTIAVGRGKPVGVGMPASGVQIGLEALCATNYLNPNIEDRFVYVIAHEYAHVQQAPALVDDEHPTVLEGSLIEGAADFIGELTSGGVAYQFAATTRGRESEIENSFVSDENKTDLSKWLYNGTPERPGDLGYWVGYRIVKSYYQQAADKQQAVRKILEMADPKAFLAKSGWYAGMQLGK